MQHKWNSFSKYRWERNDSGIPYAHLPNTWKSHSSKALDVSHRGYENVPRGWQATGNITQGLCYCSLKSTVTTTLSFQPTVKCGRDTKASLFPGDRGLLLWAALVKYWGTLHRLHSSPGCFQSQPFIFSSPLGLDLYYNLKTSTTFWSFIPIFSYRCSHEIFAYLFLSPCLFLRKHTWKA
jgi:hypothetical protein